MTEKLYFEKKPTCPFCKHPHDTCDFFDYGKTVSSEHDSELRVHMECGKCNKLFEASFDQCNQSDGFSSYVIDCEDLNKKHKFDKEPSIYVSERDQKRYHSYNCSVCGDIELKRIDENNREYTKKEIETLYRNSQAENQPLLAGKKGQVSHSDTHFSIQSEKPEGNRELFLMACSLMKSIGFKVETSSRLVGDFKSLSYYYKQGSYQNLGFEAHYYPAGLSLEFFPLKENGERNYERSDINKLSYLVQKKLEYSLEKLSLFFEDLKEHNLKRKVEILEWHNRPNLSNLTKEQAIKKIKAYPQPDIGASYNRTDKDKVNLENGMIRYAYNYQNILIRGEVYHNINNMWWIVTKDNYYNICCHDLFSYKPEIPVKKVNRLAKLKAELSKALSEENYERCSTLRDLIKEEN